MSECVHWWLLEAPGADGTPSVCMHCGAEKTWPRPNYQALADGRPFLMRDPLLKRAETNLAGFYGESW